MGGTCPRVLLRTPPGITPSERTSGRPVPRELAQPVDRGEVAPVHVAPSDHSVETPAGPSIEHHRDRGPLAHPDRLAAPPPRQGRDGQPPPPPHRHRPRPPRTADHQLVGVDPLSFNPEAVSDAGGLPIGRWGGISLDHPLGVEPGTGRDIFARLLYGSRISLLIAVTGTFITLVLGVTIGIIAGYARGWLDAALGRADGPHPRLPAAAHPAGALAASDPAPRGDFGLEPDVARIMYIILVLSFFGWPYLARIVRGQVLSLREREFVESAVSMGAGTPRILFKEILPNLWAPILVYATLLLPTFIAAEAALSFLGVGLLPPTPSWGAMLAESVPLLHRAAGLPVHPGHLPVPRRADLQPARRRGPGRPRPTSRAGVARQPTNRLPRRVPETSAARSRPGPASPADRDERPGRDQKE